MMKEGSSARLTARVTKLNHEISQLKTELQATKDMDEEKIHEMEVFEKDLENNIDKLKDDLVDSLKKQEKEEEEIDSLKEVNESLENRLAAVLCPFHPFRLFLCV